MADTDFSPADVLDLARYMASRLRSSGVLSVQQLLTTRGNAFRLLGILFGAGPQIQSLTGFDPSERAYVVLMTGTFAGTPPNAEGKGAGRPVTSALLVINASTGMIVGSSVWSDAVAETGKSTANAAAIAANQANVAAQVSRIGSLSTPVVTTASSTMPAHMQALSEQLPNPTN